ncbi:hypothetical protein [Kribbella sp. NPDC051137]|jgi:hypothetical protein|uniref:hypothetical protein n=1 Tax=Kribbella sp. NPDC051137 TaxID=3155045 RepID=UPI002F45668A
MIPELVLALVFMVAVMALIMKDAAPWRGGTRLHARRWSFLRRYDDDTKLWPSLVLGAIAVGALLEVDQLQGSAAGCGAFLGLLCGLLWRFGLDKPGGIILAGICLAGSSADIAELGETHPANRLYPYVLLGLLTACYLGGAVFGGVRNLLSARRAQAYFAIVDVVVFMVSPGGADLYSLGLWRHLGYLAVTCLTCAALGFVDVGIVVVLMAAAAAVTNFVLSSGSSLDTPLAIIAALVAARVALYRRRSSNSGVAR